MNARENLSYGEIAARDAMGVGDACFTPDGDLMVIVEVTLSTGDDAENTDADWINVGDGRGYYRGELEAADLDALRRDGTDERRDASVPTADILVATLVQRPETAGGEYWFVLPDGERIDVGDAEPLYWAIAARLDGTDREAAR